MTIDLMDDTSPYLRTFLTDRPKHGIEAMQARLRSSFKLNDELAEYFKERALVEEQYAKSLAKLSKRVFVPDKEAFGGLAPAWDMLRNELSETSTIHADMAVKMTETIERPLRSCIQNNPDYASIKTMDLDFQKLVKDYEDAQMKIAKQKYTADKAGSKKKQDAESKLADHTQHLSTLQTQWKRSAPDYIQKYEAVENYRWQALQSYMAAFEALQNDQLLKRVEMAGDTLTAINNFHVQDEIISFCGTAHTALMNKATMLEASTQSKTVRSMKSFDSFNVSDSLPRSTSESSFQNTKSLKKPEKQRKFLSTLVSIRRRPKADSGYVNADTMAPEFHEYHSNHASSMGDNSSIHSNAFSYENQSGDLHSPVNADTPASPTSLTPPSLRKAPSFTGSFMSGTSQQPPKVLVDAEGYSIPPPDRAAWPDIASLSQLHDGEESDSSSMMANGRLKVDIKNETVKEEDASHAAVALTRVASLLKEKKTSTPKRPRGRRENMRSMQLLNPVMEKEQDQPHNATPSPDTLTPLPTHVEEPPVVSPFEDDFDSNLVNASGASEKTVDFTGELPQVKVRITETVHAVLQKGEITKAAVWGEVYLTYQGPSESASPVCFRLDNVDMISQISPNANYVTLLEGYTDVYRLNTNMFHLAGDIPVMCMKYLVNNVNDVPLIVKPMWKCDDDQSRLLVKFRAKNKALQLENITLMTTVTSDVENAQSIPAGEWLVEQQCMVWPIGKLDGDEESVLKARFTTKSRGSPHPLAIRFEAKQQLFSSVQITKGEDNLILWAKIMEVQTSVRSGKYIAEI
ncbi:Muniscin C-terminal mu homology domain-containing protein [Radiomyces spectabilis]|uniref:Muniscin C-terminal mu homology domain-containing protein n=1 Tax=Radiomyces spectabilis TaxID=64574 RepID=UPI00221F4756|nr:Muniscin C-terminal mu homology domain-containing protein [Radiomyces spectabilis]KAI8376230.1 Muniscin C-terminal mu homology domain-containing protein [Radiomyces spectabilis]